MLPPKTRGAEDRVMRALLATLIALCGGLPVEEAEQPECLGWANSGECERNSEFMLRNCASSCASAQSGGGIPRNEYDEMEQCGGWADQGECTRNPKYMLDACPHSCGAQRAKIYEGMLDEAADCVDAVTQTSSCEGSVGERCAGSCAVFRMCEDEAHPPECRRALRCRELKDDERGCRPTHTPFSPYVAPRFPHMSESNSHFSLGRWWTREAVVPRCDLNSLFFTDPFSPYVAPRFPHMSEINSSGPKGDGALLKRCYLSCARHDLAGVLSRFRSKITVRTRRHGKLDEDANASALSGAIVPLTSAAPPLSAASARARRLRAMLSRRHAGYALPCWKGSHLDPIPPATCESSRAALLWRWRRKGERRCAALSSLTPRAGVSRSLGWPEALREGLEQAHQARVVPLLLGPKLRLVAAPLP